MSYVPLGIHRAIGGLAPREPTLPQHTAVTTLETAIAAQVRALRCARGLSVADMATQTGMSKATISRIEGAQRSCSLATLAKLAAVLDVPVTALFRGADARAAVHTEAGRGSVIPQRTARVDHHCELLGTLGGRHKRLEPVRVTLTGKSQLGPLSQHPGTRLLFMLEGVMVYRHGEIDYTMRPGDALLIDGQGLHGLCDLVRPPIQFLAVTAYPDPLD